MDNRTIEEVRKNENKLINEIKVLEQQCKRQKEVIDKAIYHLDFFISDTNLSKYDTLKILMHTKKILKRVDKEVK